MSWGWTKDAAKEAQAQGIELWDFREILEEIGSGCVEEQKYFTDDTMRTIQLFRKASSGKR